MNLETLCTAVASAAAIRARARLEPAGGVGDKVFPATYEGGGYAYEDRIVMGETVRCVLLDAVQSQANRFELALQEAIDRGRLQIPVITVTFPADLSRELGPITSLTAPHRCYDALLRDADLDGTPFPKSDLGLSLSQARASDALALYRSCPTVLVFGGWDSTGPRGGSGIKFVRAVACEIVGVNVVSGVKTSSRMDPAGIRSQVTVSVPKGDRQGWTLADQGDKTGKRPSEINHGNIPPTVSSNGGVTVAYAEETWVLSLPALRRYSFPVEGEMSEARDIAARTVLAALAVAARALARDDGYFLRSRCHLVPVPGAVTFEIVERDGTVMPIADLRADEALSLLVEAVAEAERLGIEWRREPVQLVAQEKLAELVRRSFALAPGGEAE